MYQTQLDALVVNLSNDLYNHKYYRPRISIDNRELHHLLIPDIPVYIFNFVFESNIKQIDPNLIDIDLQCQSFYGDSFCYPIILFINGQKGLQEIAGKQIYYPKRLNEFANKFKDKYKDYIEEAVDYDEEELQRFLESSKINVEFEDLQKVFGPLFAEA